MDEYPIVISDHIWACLCQMADISRPVERAQPDPEQKIAKISGYQAMLEYVRRHPGATTFEVADSLGQKRRTALTYLTRLETAGKVRKESAKPNRWYAV